MKCVPDLISSTNNIKTDLLTDLFTYDGNWVQSEWNKRVLGTLFDRTIYCGSYQTREKGI